MPANGKVTAAVAERPASFVDASGYEFREKDLKAGLVRFRKKASKPAKNDSKDKATSPRSDASSPVLPDMDEKTMAEFPSGRPRDDPLDMRICKHCKLPILTSAAAEHVKGCLRAKQEKARKRKEAREALAREKAGLPPEDKEGSVVGDDDGKDGKGAKKSASKTAADDGKKGKKRKADEEGDKAPKKKKKKDEQKPKLPKPKVPVDVERQCGVQLPQGGQCARSLTCKSHPMGAKRAVPGRSLPYDILLAQYQKKNQARQQKAAIDANAPLQDDENIGPVDSDEETEAVLAGVVRSRPQPMATYTIVHTRKKYQFIRLKEQLQNAMRGSKGAGLFSVVDTSLGSGINAHRLGSESPGDSVGGDLTMGLFSGLDFGGGDMSARSSIAQQGTGSISAQGGGTGPSGGGGGSKKNSVSGT